MPDPQELDRWFVEEVLPLEGMLTRTLRRQWRRGDDVADLRQDIYLKVYEAARRDGFPENPRAYLFAVARNAIIDRARRLQVVDIEVAADADLSDRLVDEQSPETIVSSRRELRNLEQAIDSLPTRCREVIVLRKVEGFSQKEIAEKLGIAVGTVEKQITIGIRSLAEYLSNQAGSVTDAFAWRRRDRGRKG